MATIHAKKNYERNIAQNIQENPKNFWSYVRSKTKARTWVADLKDTDGYTASTDTKSTEQFLRFSVYKGRYSSVTSF